MVSEKQSAPPRGCTRAGAHPPRGLLQRLVQSISTRGKHSTFSCECLSKQVTEPQQSPRRGQTFSDIPVLQWQSMSLQSSSEQAEHG